MKLFFFFSLHFLVCFFLLVFFLLFYLFFLFFSFLSIYVCAQEDGVFFLSISILLDGSIG